MAVVLPECSEIINAWIFDYVYALVWDQFKTNKSVDDGQIRDLIQGCLYLLGDNYNPSQELRVLLVQLLCRLSDGEDFERQYVGLEELGGTVLEDAVALCGKLEEHTLIHGNYDLSDLREDIGTQAVCVCLGEESGQAQDVLERLTQADMIKTSQHDLLKKRISVNKKLADGQYNKFLTRCLKRLEPLHEVVKRPILLDFAEKVIERMGSRHQSPSRQVRERLPAELLIHCNGREMEGLKRRYNITQAEIEEELASKRLRKKQQSLSSEKEHHLSTVSRYWNHSSGSEFSDEDREHSSPIRSSKMHRQNDHMSSKHSSKHHQEKKSHRRNDHHSSPHRDNGIGSLRQFHYRRGENREDRHAISASSTSHKHTPHKSRSMTNMDAGGDRSPRPGSSSSSSVLAGIPSLPPKQKVRRSLAPRPLNVMSTLRRVWTEEEVSRLIQGVRRYGEGEWAVIKSQMKFTARSNVNLKDKWRQIKKTVDLSRDSEENGK